MKAFKYLSIAAVTLAMAACSDASGAWSGDTGWDNDLGYNTKDGVTVQLGETAVDVTENEGIFSIPVVVTGEPNGYIRVDVELLETGENPAMVNAHYYATSTFCNISPEKKTGKIELRTHDNRGLDPTRTFIVKIKSVKGNATVGGINETFVSIYDKGSSPLYSELAGQWMMSGVCYDFDSGELNSEYMSAVTMRANDPVNNTVTIGTVPLQNIQSTLTLWYNYDVEEGYGDLVLRDGASYGSMQGYNFVVNTGVGDIVGKWNSKYNAVTFGDSNTSIYIDGYAADGSGGTMDIMGYFTLSRLND